ncbi:LysR family transcriptional regulator [Rheinheimera mangrovi]|uniref:LysR family transcriptional regulator n=1 Tax=Rheinheimera mangrovi TaxID=2498451 RepID=UPI000F8DF00C|nr:LysR family transcriptional regulator [Rheinheimera mangrovi]
MAQNKMNDLQAFLAVAQQQSFTKAAAILRVTPSALSHTIRALEERLGVRLLTRTTRNVSLTEAGVRLSQSITPLFEQINAELDALAELRDKPKGTIRLTCTDDQIQLHLRPMLANFLRDYPEIQLELYVDYGFTNLVEERFDAGIRLGESISKDMIAVRIGPDWRLVVVGSPDYFERTPAPITPDKLTEHSCINIRHRVAGSIYAWEFEKDQRSFTVKAEGPLVFNSIMHVLNAAVDGIGLAYVPEPLVAPYLADGRLKMILTDWSPYFQGYHLYYPNRRQASPAFMAFVDAIRYRENK